MRCTAIRDYWAVWLIIGGALGGMSACSAPASNVTAAPQATATTAATASAVAATTAAPEAQPEPVAPKTKPLPNTGELLTNADIKKVVRASYPTMTKCFEEGLARDPQMSGRIDVVLAIADEGQVVRAAAAEGPKRPKPGVTPALKDATVRQCVERHFRGLRFPPTNRGIMNLVYPVEFSVE